MKEKFILFLALALFLHTSSAIPQQKRISVLLPSSPGQTSEAIPVSQSEINLLTHNKIPSNEMTDVNLSSIIDTLLSPVEYSLRFGASPGDTMAMYFKPPFACVVKSIGMIFSAINEGGNCHQLSISLVKSNYHANTPPDSIDMQGWMGTFIDGIWNHSSWARYPILWETGHKPLWGDSTITIYEPLHQWVIINLDDLGMEPDVKDNDFLVLMVPVGDPGSIIRWEAGDATDHIQWRGLKSYAEGGISGNNGWHIRHWGWRMFAVVEFYENTPPQISPDGPYLTVLNANAKPLSCQIIDVDASNDALAGVASARLYYKVNDGNYQSVAMNLISGTDRDGMWEGTLPAGYMQPGDILTYKFSATDKGGLSSESSEGSFSFFHKQTDLLVFYNDDGTSFSPWILSSQYDNLWMDELGNHYIYDVWVGKNDGPLSSELVNMYHHIIQLDGYSPATMNDDVIGEWFATGNRNLFWSSQEWGYKLTEGFDSTFAADDWHNTYLGIQAIGPMDINPDYHSPFPINPVPQDVISGQLASFVGDSLQLYIASKDRLGWNDWCDALTAGDDAVICFTDLARNRTLGIHKSHEGNKAVFLTFDPLSLTTAALPSYAGSAGIYWTEPNVVSVCAAALKWFDTPTVIKDDEITGIIDKFSLSQNYPNPFNAETKISYTLSTAGHVKLAVYNILGQKIEELVNEYQPANTYQVIWKANNLASNVYIYRLEIGDYSRTMKMILLR